MVLQGWFAKLVRDRSRLRNFRADGTGNLGERAVTQLAFDTRVSTRARNHFYYRYSFFSRAAAPVAAAATAAAGHASRIPKDILHKRIHPKLTKHFLWTPRVRASMMDAARMQAAALPATLWARSHLMHFRSYFTIPCSFVRRNKSCKLVYWD